LKTVIAAAIGECVHVAGVSNFLRLAEKVGWRVIFLGPATPIHKILDVAKKENADLVGVSYRLTPENGERLMGDFAEAADDLKSNGVKFAFGGTPPVVDRIKKLDFFEVCFDGSETTDDVIAYLKGQNIDKQTDQYFPANAIDRINEKSPLPLIRHHFGLPTMQDTIEGIRIIAESKIIDVISLGVDQESQENFFHPEKQKKQRYGAGGVPVRTPEDYRKLFKASRYGNFPLMRTYSGTDDFLQLAEMHVETINQAWAAVPLYWFNQMDGRGPWDLEGSIREHKSLMAWYGARNIPVEANEAHHWGMRDSHDVVFVVSAYLAAYNARAFGVKDHIVQMMFNCPPGTSAAMDIAKMCAVIEIISELETKDFRIWKQTRTGLLSYPLDMDEARAHLATTVFTQMALKPDIVHVVGYPEAHHAVTGPEVVESCKIAKKAIDLAMQSQINLTNLENIQERIQELIIDAKTLINAICQLGDGSSVDPLTNSVVLSKAIFEGLLDAPQLVNNPFGKGEISTMIDHRGACVAFDKNTGKNISEENRISEIMVRR